MSMRILTGSAGLVAAGLLFATALQAQDRPVYEQTGTVEITFGERQMQHFTTANTVPGEPGRQVHTASWITLEPRLLGGVNISPDDIFVLITSRDTVEPVSEQDSLRVEFSLDPATLGLKTKPAASVRFYPAKGEADFYALTDGTFTIENVTRTDEDTFSILASAQGTMTAQTSETIVHNSDDAQEFSARFKLEQVVNRNGTQQP